MQDKIVNLSINPCKMCMPMGAVSALYGIKNCISILHGSQGCSTYIRRHMATHYNEPVDIASSSLTEEGTVYGGEKNLIKGLENLIQVYNPDVIGVPTTCLAETIGEDVKRIIADFYELHPEHKNITIIPVPSAGYAGTQYEGFFKSIMQIIKSVEMETEKHNRVNIITGMLSPADTRYLKKALQLFQMDYILLPDLSENLDGIHKDEYERLPSGGTDIQDVKKMAGSKLTIEISGFLEGENSPAEFLKEQYGVEFERIHMPVGLRDTDTFLELLSRISGKEIPEDFTVERGRYLDAMIDSHKYNGEGRAVVFGEVDFVLSTVRLCCENGIMPVISATGTVCASLKDKMDAEILDVANRYYIKDYKILDDIDFKVKF